jgi:hypothetical protein
LFIPENIDLRTTKKKGKGLFAKTSFILGQKVFSLSTKLKIRPNFMASPMAIQIDDDSYIDTDKTVFWHFINHSCNPNCKVDLEQMSIIAVKKIAKGEEMSFNYNTTEFDLLSKNESFDCYCGFKNCVKIVKGFRHLSRKQKISIASLLIPYTKRKLLLGKNQIEILIS